MLIYDFVGSTSNSRQMMDDDNIPPPLWREEHEYHTTTVEEQMADTNLDKEDLEDTAANINVVLSSSAAAATHHKPVPRFRSWDPAADINQHLRQKSSSVWAIKSCPHMNVKSMSSHLNLCILTSDRLNIYPQYFPVFISWFLCLTWEQRVIKTTERGIGTKEHSLL